MAPFRLGLGQLGPLQQSSVSCGAACLAVARMLRDPATAQWVVEGPAGDARAPNERFADLERRIMRRTNAAWPEPGRLQAPWPRALGTSPWGALAELEARVADPGTTYRLLALRALPPDGLGRVFDDVVARTRPGEPLLLYVGSAALPRHVCLIFADEKDRMVLLYEPSGGGVQLPSREAFVASRLALGGWDVPWFLIAPGTRTAGAAAAVAARLLPSPRRAAGPAMLRRSSPASRPGA